MTDRELNDILYPPSTLRKIGRKVWFVFLILISTFVIGPLVLNTTSWLLAWVVAGLVGR